MSEKFLSKDIIVTDSINGLIDISLYDLNKELKEKHFATYYSNDIEFILSKYFKHISVTETDKVKIREFLTTHGDKYGVYPIIFIYSTYKRKVSGIETDTEIISITEEYLVWKRIYNSSETKLLQKYCQCKYCLSDKIFNYRLYVPASAHCMRSEIPSHPILLDEKQ